MKRIIETIENNRDQLIKIVLSDTKIETKKIVVHPVEIQNQEKWQIERFVGTKVYHENVEFQKLLNLPFSDYKQILIETEGKSFTFSIAKNGYKMRQNENNFKKEVLTHDRQKNYIIRPEDDCPALLDLGVVTKDGKIVNAMFDKFKQINKFIELIDDAFKNTDKTEITILDFGCGKSYLTFLVYYYFVKIKHIKAKIIGYDIKQDVVSACNKIAKKYGYDDLEFVLSDVKKDKLFSEKVDMIITLHACDTATDFALDFAIKNNVKYIFSVPCCQHEVNASITNGGDFDILMEDGVIKERFCALLTDAMRVEILRAKGYSVDIIEFVNFENTPKNLMIRATKNSTKKSILRAKNLKEKYKFNQTLFDLQINN
ncbi:MAG: class I SAM-dependent methyltransferase [Candidatus Onthoplasma sp.]